jgi:pimeloyl-ACP methyl ester carboxylesterase
VRLNPGVLRYTATANYARDMNRLRRSVGDKRLSYFGFSYGTFIGETYAALFPRRIRALVLDGALDPDRYINRPMSHLRIQTAGFERALGRFFQACAAHQDVCTFGGDDPHQAFDELVEQADRSPTPAGGADPRPVDGEDILFGSFGPLYSKFAWPDLAAALNALAGGDGTLMRELADGGWGRNPDGTYEPFNDRYLLLSAEQRYRNDLRTYLDAGEESWASFDHYWWNTGYVELYWARIPVAAQGAYYGPFEVPDSASGTPLVIGTTYDPATPYREARLAVAELGNARLLTMRGDGHTAYFNGSDCIDHAVNTYVITLALPSRNTVCRQDVPFPLPEMATAGAGLVRGFAGRGTAPFRPVR